MLIAGHAQVLQELAEAWETPERVIEIFAKSKRISDALEEGISSPEEVAQRIRIAGLKAGANPRILGEHKMEVAEGLYQDVSKLFLGSTIIDLVEEHKGHGEFFKALHEGRVKWDEAVEATNMWAAENPNFAISEDMTEDQKRTTVNEAVADMIKAKFFGNSKQLEILGKLPPSVQAFIEMAVEWFREVMKSAGVLKQMEADGKFTEDWQDFLAEAVGLQEAKQVEKQAQEVVSSIDPESTQFSIDPRTPVTPSDESAAHEDAMKAWEDLPKKSQERLLRVAASQMQRVRKMYEGTTQWLKAPNGENTNLTEEQWLTVRTPLFKRWFGDWEALSRQTYSRSLIQRALNDNLWQTRTILAEGVNADPSGKLSEAFGFKVNRQYITPDDIRKINKRHGEGNEKDSSQVGLTEDDYVKALEVLRDPETFKKTTSRNGKPSAEFGRAFTDGTLVVAEVEVSESGAVSIKSVWKKLPGRNHTGASSYPIRTPESAAGDIKSIHSDSLVVNPENVSKFTCMTCGEKKRCRSRQMTGLNKVSDPERLLHR